MCMMASTKEKVQEKKTQLMELTKEFSQQYLNEEYDSVIEKLINKMARKREVPFLTGRIEIWAAAVIHALGTVNFLFDRASVPYVAVTEIFQFFGTKQSTTTQKSKRIRDMFNMGYFDSEFTTKTINQANPFNNLTTINGLLVPKDLVQVLDHEQREVEEWELEVAQILGVLGLKKDKNCKEKELFELMEVTFESLMVFYRHLEQHMTFPFSALIEDEVGPFEVIERCVDCIRLEQNIKVDQLYGILVECRLGREKIIVPLAEIEVDDDHVNSSIIALYQDWFWNYR